MPRGVYNRKKAAKRGRAKASKVKAAKAPKIIATLSQRAVMTAFQHSAENWRRQSIVLSCSAAVCMIVGAHSNGDSVAHDVMIERLKKQVGMTTGLSGAQVSKYLGLARALTGHLFGRFKVGGPVGDVLTATKADEAIEVLTKYLAKQKVTTLEGLTVMFGKYKRKRTASTGRTVGRRTAQAPAGRETGAGAVADSVPLAPEMKEAQEQESFTMRLKVTPTPFIILTAVKAGHAPNSLAEASIGLVSLESELDHLSTMIDDRRKQLKSMTPAASPAPVGKESVAA